MKIAFIGQKGIPTQQGGIEKHVEELSQKLVQLGFDISVYSRPRYTGQTKNSYSYNGVKIINLPSIPTKHLDAISHTFIATIHSLFQDYDIIHYHGVGPALLSWIPRIFKPQTKIIATFHCIDRQHQKWGAFAKFMLGLGEYCACKFPHQTIAISKILEKYCRYRFDDQVRYIPNGVDLKNYKESNILNDLNLTSKNYIVAISRLVRHKGIHTLIKAYDGTATDKKLIIVGDGANTDEYVDELNGLAKNNSNIIFAGQKTGADLSTLFANAYLFVQPSETEGLSIALLEAMAYGVPTIISNIEENQEPAEGVALEFINKSSEDLRRQLQFALKNEAVILDLAKKARERVLRDYDWNNIARETANLYNEVVAETNQLAFAVREIK